MFFGCRMMPVKTANTSLNTIIQRQVKCLVENCSEQSWPQAAIQQGTISRIHWNSFGKSFLKVSLN